MDEGDATDLREEPDAELPPDGEIDAAADAEPGEPLTIDHDRTREPTPDTAVRTDRPTRLRRVCVFCGSTRGDRPSYAAAARTLGKELVGRGIGVVYGGGRVGLMGELADAAMSAGGEVIGIIPRRLSDLEVGHDEITELRLVKSLHERKGMMADLSDAFVALPGGIGTFDELFEALSWTQLGIHDKPVGLLDVDGYYEPLLTFLDSAVESGFLRPEHRAMLRHARSPGLLLDTLAGWSPTIVDTWEDGR